MRIEQADDRLTVHAPAKLNLYLDVLSRRTDGYHEVDTVIQAIDIYDRLDLIPADRGVHLKCSLPDLPTDERNVVYRAAESILERADATRGVEITLTKRIPVGGGLGGGSSDAAATLVGMNRLFDLRLPRHEIADLAADLGSDVPFFLSDGAARCRGRGERVEPIEGAAPIEYVVVWPGIPCSTAEVYQALRFGLTPQNHGASFVAGALVSNDPGQIAAGRFNRLEEVVYRLHPVLTEIKRALERSPLRGVGVTGSGSCLFGLVDPASAGEDIEKQIHQATGLAVYRARGLGQ
ncbi:MAG: 4-(cytidine 5'-diphospho)-2-C-methyl-D-erythritol kinase [Planctomycetota bacterium]|nr:4-(cytidine 5'-diphospho)-2-C-methyl-D-erythritol kinase [Planctomycetota bacterium]